MKMRIKRFDKELPLPVYQTTGAVAMDCVARESAVIEPKTLAYIPLNVAIKPPPGHLVLLAPRSSLHKRGLMLPNSVGVFDEDFSGNEDEYKAAVYNFTDAAVAIERGERIVQLLVLPYVKAEWEEVDDMGKPTRGGFGSTGK